MNVSDLMRTNVHTAAPDESLKDAARTLVQHGISGLPVTEANGRVIGVVSEGDILYKERGRLEHRGGPLAWLVEGSSGADRKAMARTVREAMTAPAITILPSSSAAAAARLMIEKGVNRLPVVTWDGRLAGIVTRADLVRAFTRSDDEIRAEIRDIVTRVLWVEPETIDVAVQDGEVQLAGLLETSTDADVLEKLTERVPGVVSVRSSVTFRISEAGRPANPFVRHR